MQDSKLGSPGFMVLEDSAVTPAMFLAGSVTSQELIHPYRCEDP
jgi:hypothetical protein